MIFRCLVQCAHNPSYTLDRDTEALSDKAVLLSFGPSLPKSVLEKSPMNEFRLPWDLKKQILGLRGAEWTPIVLGYAKEHWGVTDEIPPPTPYVI